jgi:hypothetical protein
MSTDSSDNSRIAAESAGVATSKAGSELLAEQDRNCVAKSDHAADPKHDSGRFVLYYDNGPLSLTQMEDLDRQMTALLKMPELQRAFGFSKIIPNRLVAVRRRARLALNESRLPANEGMVVPWLLLARNPLNTFVNEAPEVGNLPECVLREPGAVTARRLQALTIEARRLTRCYGLENLYQVALRCMNKDAFDVAPKTVWVEAVIGVLCGLTHFLRRTPAELPELLAWMARLEGVWRSASARTVQDSAHDVTAMALVEHFAESWGRPPTEQDFELKEGELVGVTEKLLRGILPEHLPQFIQTYAEFETHPLTAVLPSKLVELLDEFDAKQAVASLKEEFLLADRSAQTKEAVAPRDNELVPFVDDDAYRPAKEFLDPMFPTYKALHKALDENPRIRRKKPSPQRLKIHVGDWMQFKSRLSKRAFESLNATPETVANFLEEARSTQAEIREQKAGK